MRQVMRVSVIWRHMIGYILTCLFCLAYSLFIDIRFGLTFLLILALTPLIMNVVNIFALRTFRLETSVSARVLRKGETVLFTACFSAAAPTFVFLRVEFHDSPHFSAESNKNLVLVPWLDTAERLERLYTAAIWGAAPVGVRSVEGADFFGLCRFVWEEDETAPAAWAAEIEVVPRLPDLRENELLHEIMAARAEDDEEETGRDELFHMGLPGFEHREYVPGDQLRRVNWKLSARTGVYMVRLNEPSVSPKVSLILDRAAPPFTARPEENLALFSRDERLVEALLGLTLLFVRAGLRCAVYIFLDGRWQKNAPETEREVSALQYRMARFRFARGAENRGAEPRPEMDGDGRTALLFSNRAENLRPREGAAQEPGTEVLTLTAAALPGAWRITPELAFVRGGV